MSYRPGGRLERDADGRLYEPDLRALAGRSLEPDRVAAVEALLSLQDAAFVLQKLMGALRNAYGMEAGPLNVLTRLRENPDGVPLPELTADLDDEDLPRLLDELERAGVLARSPMADTVRVRLTDAGARRVDDALRTVADRLSAVTDGVAPDALATLRHICLTLARNGRERHNR